MSRNPFFNRELKNCQPSISSSSREFGLDFVLVSFVVSSISSVAGSLCSGATRVCVRVFRHQESRILAVELEDSSLQ